MSGHSSSSTFHVFKIIGQILLISNKIEQLNLLVMYANPCGLGFWDFALLLFVLIIISFSTWDYKNWSYGAKSILLWASCRDSKRNWRMRTFRIVGKSRNDGISRLWCLRWWNRHFIVPKWSGRNQLRH